MAKKLSIKLVRSLIGTTEKQRRIVESLGLKKRLATVTHTADAGLIGKLEKVQHLLEVTEAAG